MNPKVILLLAVLASCTTGCVTASQSSKVENGPSSSMPRFEARFYAGYWVSQSPKSRTFCEVMGTGSMRPLLGKRSILLLEVVGPNDIRRGDIVTLHRSQDGRDIVHRVGGVGDVSVWTEGLSARSDGWQPKGAVEWRVAGILYGSS